MHSSSSSSVHRHFDNHHHNNSNSNGEVEGEDANAASSFPLPPMVTRHLDPATQCYYLLHVPSQTTAWDTYAFV